MNFRITSITPMYEGGYPQTLAVNKVCFSIMDENMDIVGNINIRPDVELNRVEKYIKHNMATLLGELLK